MHTLAGVQLTPGSHEPSPALVKTQAKLMERILRALYPGRHISRAEIQLLIWEAYRSTDDTYGEGEALTWADGYRFPADIAYRDMSGLTAAHGNLAEFTRRRHEEMSSEGRLSHASIDAVVPPDDPDSTTLHRLVEGIQIFVPPEPDFVANGRPPTLRAKYVRLAPVVNKLMAQLHAKGLIFILPTEAAMKISGIHFSQAHWAVKKGKRQGRPIGDASAAEEGSTPLNSDAVKEMATSEWGTITHPTIRDLCAMVLTQAQDTSWDDLVIWKMDLRGAFTLLFVHPEDCQRLAFQLTDDLTMLFHTGMFGWTGMPAAFQVITRVLERCIQRTVHGRVKMYVDDLMGVCHRKDLDHDLAQARSLCTSLLGPEAVEDTKTESGRRLDWIGWSIDLDLRSVSVSRHNFLKTLHGFLSVTEAEPIPVRSIQRLASWASRYSAICRTLKPFTSDLFSVIRGLHHGSTLITLDTHAQRAIQLWRATLIALEVDREGFSRPITSFGPRSASYQLEYDASLQGLGMVLTDLRTSPPSLLRAVKVTLPFDLGSDSSFQNTVEFMAVTVGLGCLAALDIRNSGVHIKGDNRSSLSWCVSQRFRHGRSRGAAMAYMALCTHCDLQVVSSDHVPGIDNIVCDRLSREGTLEELGFHPDDSLDITLDPRLVSLVELCNPMVDAENAENFLLQWTGATTVARALAQPR